MLTLTSLKEWDESLTVVTKCPKEKEEERSHIAGQNAKRYRHSRKRFVRHTPII